MRKFTKEDLENMDFRDYIGKFFWHTFCFVLIFKSLVTFLFQRYDYQVEFVFEKHFVPNVFRCDIKLNLDNFMEFMTDSKTIFSNVKKHSGEFNHKLWLIFWQQNSSKLFRGMLTMTKRIIENDIDFLFR